MEPVVRFDDPRPPYVQLAAALRDAITSGELAPGDQLPAGRQLAEDNGISIPTVRHAFELLRDEGLIVSQQGRGVYVTYEPPATPPDVTAPTAEPDSADVAGQEEPTAADGRGSLRDALDELRGLLDNTDAADLDLPDGVDPLDDAIAKLESLRLDLIERRLDRQAPGHTPDTPYDPSYDTGIDPSGEGPGF